MSIKMSASILLASRTDIVVYYIIENVSIFDVNDTDVWFIALIPNTLATF